MERATTGWYQLYVYLGARWPVLDDIKGELSKLNFVLSQEAPAPDPHFFERLEKEVMRELKKEKQQAEIEAAPESARVAQLTNELEKRDSLIKKLQVENEYLVVCNICICMCICVSTCWGQRWGQLKAALHFNQVFRITACLILERIFFFMFPCFFIVQHVVRCQN